MSRSINTPRKNLTNIQPPRWPHSWSITDINCCRLVTVTICPVCLKPELTRLLSQTSRWLDCTYHIREGTTERISEWFTPYIMISTSTDSCNVYIFSGWRHEEKQRGLQQSAPWRCLCAWTVHGRSQVGHTDRNDSRIKTERTDSWYARHVYPRHSSRQTRNQERLRVSSV